MRLLRKLASERLPLVLLSVLTWSACSGLALPRQATPNELASPETWESPAWGNHPLLGAVPGDGLSLMLPPRQHGAAATKTIDLDLDATPILAIRVAALSPGASWALKMDNRPYNPAHPHDVQPLPNEAKTPGLYLTDLREVGGWRGRQSLELRLFVLGPPGATVAFSRITLLPVTHPRARAFAESQSVLTSGQWQMSYYAGERRFVLHRANAWGGLTGVLPIGDHAISVNQSQEADGKTLHIHASNDWADFEVVITAYDRPAGLFHWTVDAEWKQPHALEPGKAECGYTMPSPSISGPGREAIQVLSTHRFGQSGPETGQAFLPSDATLGGTALYVENFSALTPYFQAMRASLDNTVSVTPEGCGYRAPNDPKHLFPAGTRLRLVDSYIALKPDDAIGPDAQARVYLDLIAILYDAMPRPPTVYADWHDLAQRTLHDLLLPECWSNEQRGYLLNYVNSAPAPTNGELIIQVDPYVAGLAYARKWQETTPIVARIAPTLAEFYAPDIRCINNSNTEKRPVKSDCWYRVYPLIQLARAAALGESVAKDLTLKSLPATIELAHKCDYEFPVFFNPQTFGDFGYNEPDCAGAYAYLMLQAYALFGDQVYVDEARQALRHIQGHGMELAYELHLTALSAAACARMWRVTGDASYLELSYIPLANLIRRCWLWDAPYGLRRDDHTFFAVSAMPGVYAAPLEEYQAWLALREYDTLAHDHLPYAAQDLVSEFLKYAPTVLRSMLPPLMTPGSIVATNNYGRRNDPALYIPVEDINDGWEQSGKLGQEIYGSAGPLAIATENYSFLPEDGIRVYCDYPVQSLQWDAQTHALQIQLGGVATHDALVAVYVDEPKRGWPESAKLRIQAQGSVTDRQEEKGLLRFRVAGAQIVTILPQSP